MTAAAAAVAAASGDHGAEQEPVELSEAYVHSLASLGLERLQNEPGRLHAEAVAVDEALHALSLDHYRVFIQNQECVRHVRAQGKEMEGHLSSLLTEVHGLGAEFSVFQREAAELVGGHKRNRQTLKHHMQLVELLEVPQLMDACVRSDLLEEALSIATFASTLERRHRSRRAASMATSDAAAGDRSSSFSATGDEVTQGDVPGVIKMIVEEVRESARELHERLVAKLRGPIQLTSCLQVVSCLRRLELLALEEKNEKKQQQQRQRALARQADANAKKGPLVKKGGALLAQRDAAGHGSSSGGGGGIGGGISRRQLALVEMKLQVDFLEARDAWLAESASRAGLAGAAGELHRHPLGSAAGGASSSSPYQALMDLIESSRSQWFEVATQFRAIFLSVDGGGSGGNSQLSSSWGAGGNGRESGDILSLWLLRRVTAFVEQLRGVLPLVEDGSLLRSLLEECMFFGASMGRLGTDFRGLLVPVFEERVSGAAAGQWATASTEFVATLRDIAAIEVAGGNGSSLLHVPDKTAAAATAAASASAADGDKKPAASGGGDGGVPSPPRSLMAFPPVARLLNLVLTSFNQLRECLPSSVEDRLADSLVLCFTEVFRGLAELTKTALRANAASDAAGSGGSGGPSSGRGRGTSAAAAAAGGAGGGGRGGGLGEHLNTTPRAVELACCALAEQVVPHLAVCFAALFGEYPADAAAATGSASTPASGRGGGAKAEGRAEKLHARLLGAMETFGIYEPPRAPAPAPAPSPPPAAAAAAAAATTAMMPAAPASTLAASAAPASPTPAAAGGATAAAAPPAADTESAEGDKEKLRAGDSPPQTPAVSLGSGDREREEAATTTISGFAGDGVQREGDA